MKIGSLFSGYGGLDLAVEHVFNARTVWHCEWEDAPSKILEAHWPGVPNYRDVTKVDWSKVEPVDILTGGFPCQDVSLAGARRGLGDGTRSGLWAEFRNAISVLRPSFVIIENVRGLLSARADSSVEQCAWCLGDEPGEPALRALGAVLGDLADLGFDAEWRGVEAADAGAPHRRFRVFILAWPKSTNANGFRSVQRANEIFATIRRFNALGHTGSSVSKDRPVRLMPTPLVSDGTGGSKDINKSEFSPQLRDIVKLIPNSQTTFVGEYNWGRFSNAIERWESLTRPAPAPTRPDGKDGAERLSPLFSEWMMGLPEGWVTNQGLSRNEELKLCGNGVVPQQAALAIIKMIGEVKNGY